MNIKQSLFFLIIAFYSLSLLFVEWQYGQPTLRYYMTDIKGDVFFYAINTTLSVTILWITALLFAISTLCVDKVKDKTAYWFYWSQVVMFTYLGFDDRFMIHEFIGAWLGKNDAYLLLGIGLIEVGLLATLGQIKQLPQKARYYLYTAALLFFIMFIIDAKAPDKLLFRLALEDLTKLWAGICLALFAWEILADRIAKLKITRV